MASVEDFLAENRIDDRAANTLRGEPAHIQEAVTSRGSLAECINPSSAVVSRIRDAKRQAGMGGGMNGGMGGCMGPGVGGACTGGISVAGSPHYAIDNTQLGMGGDGLGGGSMGGGAAGSCMGGGMAGGMGGSMGSMSAMAPMPAGFQFPQVAPEMLENFIAMNRLDERAAQMFRNESPIVQQNVMERGSLSECSNPSSAVVSRIKDAKKQANAMGLIMQNGGSGGCMGCGMTDGGMGGAMGGGISGAITMPDMGGCMAGGMGGCMSAPLSQVQGPPTIVEPREVEEFIAACGIDERAANTLRGESANVQRAVIDRGLLVDCTNPSSALIGRIRDARQQAPLMAATGPVQMDPIVVEQFIATSGIDERCAVMLRREPPAIQRAVIDRGSLEGITKTSPVVIGRIRDAKKQQAQMSANMQISASSGGMPMPPMHMGQMQRMPGTYTVGTGESAAMVEQFIMSNNLDERAANSLRVEPIHIQNAVMSRGSLSECSNPSSAFVARLRDAKKQAGQAQLSGIAAGQMSMPDMNGVAGMGAMASFGGMQGMDGMGGCMGGQMVGQMDSQMMASQMDGQMMAGQMPALMDGQAQVDGQMAGQMVGQMVGQMPGHMSVHVGSQLDCQIAAQMSPQMDPGLMAPQMAPQFSQQMAPQMAPQVIGPPGGQMGDPMAGQMAGQMTGQISGMGSLSTMDPIALQQYIQQQQQMIQQQQLLLQQHGIYGPAPGQPMAMVSRASPY